MNLISNLSKNFAFELGSEGELEVEAGTVCVGQNLRLKSTGIL